LPCEMVVFNGDTTLMSAAKVPPRPGRTKAGVVLAGLTHS
jgi:hypothetical protein